MFYPSRRVPFSCRSRAFSSASSPAACDIIKLHCHPLQHTAQGFSLIYCPRRIQQVPLTVLWFFYFFFYMPPGAWIWPITANKSAKLTVPCASRHIQHGSLILVHFFFKFDFLFWSLEYGSSFKCKNVTFPVTVSPAHLTQTKILYIF